MSHAKERAEKICLNCNSPLHGRYCHHCGQENIEPRTSVWGLITHFFYDITHFDGKFFSTTKFLITRPGFLSREYMRGRRAAYLNPIRMYIFTSAFFFLIFFSLYNADQMAFTDTSDNGEIPEMQNDAASLAVKPSDTAGAYRYEPDTAIRSRYSTTDTVQPPQPPSTGPAKKARKSFRVTKSDYKTKAEYDSVQRALPESKRDNWLERQVELRTIALANRYGRDQKELMKDVVNGFIHSFPYLLFVSLPLYALYLKLLYVRRKKFYYVDHSLFLIHLYIFTFLFLLVFFGIADLRQRLGWGWLDWLEGIMVCWGIYYAWRAMHKFYEQRRFKTLVKFVLFNIICFVSIAILFVLFFTLTIFRI